MSTFVYEVVTHRCGERMVATVAPARHEGGVATDAEVGAAYTALQYVEHTDIDVDRSAAAGETIAAIEVVDGRVTAFERRA